MMNCMNYFQWVYLKMKKKLETRVMIRASVNHEKKNN